MTTIAVIGCGSISCMHLDPASALEEAELVAVCDIKPDKAERAAQKYNARPYTDYMEMFEKEQLEKEIIKLNAKPYLSEYEFQTLQTDKAKLRNLRRILNGNN